MKAWLVAHRDTFFALACLCFVTNLWVIGVAPGSALHHVAWCALLLWSTLYLVGAWLQCGWGVLPARPRPGWALLCGVLVLGLLLSMLAWEIWGPSPCTVRAVCEGCLPGEQCFLEGNHVSHVLPSSQQDGSFVFVVGGTCKVVCD